MKPKRGSGPSPRVVACANEKAEGKYSPMERNMHWSFQYSKYSF